MKPKENPFQIHDLNIGNEGKQHALLTSGIYLNRKRQDLLLKCYNKDLMVALANKDLTSPIVASHFTTSRLVYKFRHAISNVFVENVVRKQHCFALH